ncbi:MAG: hypothetical protein NUW24_02170 [Anaerolineae bacterium]|jgi:hypothetical protein|nr:hypothetical protein [Anaerolineae bacterium]MDH7472634.1 hypothetical protein [Anaerolineae bacterium]
MDVYSVRQINNLPREEKLDIYSELILPELLARYGISAETLTDVHGNRLVEFICEAGTSFVEMEIWPAPGARDPLLSLQIADTVNGQLEVLLFVINDPDGERFDVDRDWQGRRTKFGKMYRNVPEEIRAMQAGLAPGQVRRGLRLTGLLLPQLERFVTRLDHDMFFIEPLAYHNAIHFERHGFAYMMGRSKMEWINAEFAPGGILYQRLDGSTPFRQPEFAHTVRGRSWAIHDGILDKPFSGIRMYKRVGRHAGVCTFPNAVY